MTRRSSILAISVFTLLALANWWQMCDTKDPANSQSRANDSNKPLTAKLVLSSGNLTVETVPDLMVNFSLTNTSTKAINPEITSSLLVVDGGIYKDSALLFGNGPRDSRFSSLPPGEKIEFRYPLGHLFQKPGEHSLAWRGENFDEVTVKLTVKREKSPWKLMAGSPWAKVSAERAAYKAAGSKQFYMHVRIENLTDKVLGFECTDRYHVFYPNQWAESQIPRRQVISEMRRNPIKLTADEVKGIVTLFNAVATTGKACTRLVNAADKRAMIKIMPHSTCDYFIAFIGGNHAELEKVELPYAIVVMDGRISLTDGKNVQSVGRPQDDSMMGEIPLETPLLLRPLPSNAVIL